MRLKSLRKQEDDREGRAQCERNLVKEWWWDSECSGRRHHHGQPSEGCWVIVPNRAAGADFRYVNFRSRWPVGKIVKCSIQHCVVVVGLLGSSASGLPALGRLIPLGMRYLPWIVGSRSLLQGRSSSRVCRGAASRGCLECSTSPLQMWFSVSCHTLDAP